VIVKYVHLKNQEKNPAALKIYETLSYLKSHNFIKPGPIFKKFGVLVSELLDLSKHHKIKET
jgi:hypothetical protein